MKNLVERLGAIPVLLLGAGLFVLGLLAMNHVVNNFWPFDVGRLDLVRATAQGRAEATAMLEAGQMDSLLAFLASVTVAVTGLVLPLVFYLNRRFREDGQSPHFLIVLRQSMWIGAWLAFCIWLQMNRALGPAVALLVAGVLIIFEILLQVRTRAASILS